MYTFEPSDVSRGERVARVTQGLVLYFESDFAEFWPAMLGVLGKLLREPWAEGLVCVRRSHEMNWKRFSVDQAVEVLGELAARGPVPYSRFEFADKPVLPELGVDWQILPRTQNRYARAGILRLRLPLVRPFADLLRASHMLAEALPVQQGRGGYLCHVDDINRKVGFDQAWVWARQYYGMDIVDTVAETWDAPKGLLGTNWITIVGPKWLSGPLSEVPHRNATGTVSIVKMPNGGVILQAGTSPTLGDHNRLQDVSAYVQVSMMIAPALIEKPTGLPGMFYDHQSTRLWMCRFIDPDAWHNKA